MRFALARGRQALPGLAEQTLVERPQHLLLNLAPAPQGRVVVAPVTDPLEHDAALLEIRARSSTAQFLWDLEAGGDGQAPRVRRVLRGRLHQMQGAFPPQPLRTLIERAPLVPAPDPLRTLGRRRRLEGLPDVLDGGKAR